MENRVPPAVVVEHLCRVVFAVRPCELPVFVYRKRFQCSCDIALGIYWSLSFHIFKSCSMSHKFAFVAWIVVYVDRLWTALSQSALEVRARRL